MPRMTGRCAPLIVVCCVAVIGLASAAPALARAEGERGTIEGVWRLVRQSYGEGQSELVRDAPELSLEFRRGAGNAWSGWLHVGGPAAARRSVAWPALEAAGRERPVEVLETRAPADGSTIGCTYRVMPGQDGSMTLEIDERYRLEAPDRLVGVVEVRFLTAQGERGGYTLRRLLERAP